VACNPDVHVKTHALNSPEKPACVDADTGRVPSYGSLEERANQGARLLRSLGLGRGDVIATLLLNSFEVFEIAWAAQRIGLYLTSISTKLSTSDVGYIVGDSGAKLLIASDQLSEGAAAALRSNARVRGFLTDRAAAGFDSWRKSREAQSTQDLEDTTPGTDMLYSSGTTGRPKGVKPPLPDGPVDAPTPLMKMGQALYGLDANTRYLSTSPLYHAAPLRWALTVQRLGGTVVFDQHFDALRSLRLIAQYRISHATFVPTHFVRMLKLPADVRAGVDVSSLKAAIHAAAPCPEPIKRAMIEWWGPNVHEYYSGTEMCGMTALCS
jgi:long-chain acyl-CoA synthetase